MRHDLPHTHLRGDGPHLPLTRHEYNALYYRALTSTRKEAAEMMGVSENAVRHALGPALHKLGCGDVLEAFRVLGWLRPTPWYEFVNPPDDDDPRPSVPWP